jgi:hypothetical protein
MIHRLRAVLPGKIFRGSAPNPEDVLWLRDILGIKKIVSLDKESGEKIARACKILGINQVKAYIDHDRKSLYDVVSRDLKKLLLDGGPTYVHCLHGKDRTSLIVALFKCKYMGMTPEAAIAEAKSLGFGIGVPLQVVHLYEKIIKSCKPNKDADINEADIVSNEREYISDNRDTFLDESRQSSWAPYLDHTKQGPMDSLYNYIDDQSPTRENYKDYKCPDKISDEDDVIPQVGIYNNDAGVSGMGGFTLNPGGFIYD